MMRRQPPRSRPPSSSGALPFVRVWACLVLGVFPLLFSCATNPVTGKRQLILMSQDAEKRIDKEAARQVAEQIGLVEDPALNAYIDELGQALARHSPRQDVRYSFHVVAMDEPNAFALPGGHIYVSRGLLVLSNSEPELANVLGHEIGHVAARHAAQRDTVMKAVNIMTVLGMIGAVVGGATASGTGGPVGNPGLYSYSRQQESEADVIGQDLAVKAGIDPMGMANFLQSLDAHARLEQGYTRRTGYFDTHPAARERAAEAATSAQVRRWTAKFSIAKTREAYLERISGLPIGSPASEGVVVDGRFLHADLGFALRFPPGWQIENMRAAVIGVAPRQEAAVMLELQGAGDDPRAAAMAYGEQHDVAFSLAQPVKAAGLDVFRARGLAPTPIGRALADISWIALEGQIFRLTGFAVRGSFGSYEGLFRSFPRSFRKLTEEERGKIDELRLQVVSALEGETLLELNERTANEWGLNQTAVTNQTPPDRLLRAGELIKIANRKPYRPSPAGEPPQNGAQ